MESAAYPLIILPSAPVIPAKVCEVEDRDGDRRRYSHGLWEMDSIEDDQADHAPVLLETGDLIEQYGPLIQIMKVSANGCINIDPREVDAP